MFISFMVQIKRKSVSIGYLVGVLLALATGSVAIADPQPAPERFSDIVSGTDGALYGLDPGRTSVFRIRTGKSGIVTRQLFVRDQAIRSFSVCGSGFAIISDDRLWLLDRSGETAQAVGQTDGAGQLDNPASVFCSSNNRIYVAEKGGDRVSVFGRNGVFLFSFGDTGKRNQRLKNPFRVFVDARERIYVLDEQDKGRISLYSSPGGWLKSLSAREAGLHPFGPAAGVLPSFDQAGGIFGLDASGQSISRYDWQTSGASKLEGITVTGIKAFAYAKGSLVVLAQDNFRSYPVDVPQLNASGISMMLDNVTARTTTAPKCTLARYLASNETICLDKKAGALIRYADDGKPLIRYGGKLQRPVLFATNKTRVAVIDDNGLAVFTLAGQRLNVYSGLKRADGVIFIGDSLIVSDDGKPAYFSADGLRVSRPEETGAQVFQDHPYYLTADSLGNIYSAGRRDDRVRVVKLASGRSYTIGRAEFSRIRGLAVDANDQLYILVKHRDGGFYVHVYRGLVQRFSFLVGNDVEPAGFSAGPGKDTLLSVYEKKSATLRRFQYQQVPVKVVGLRVNGSADQVVLSWVRSVEPTVTGYAVYGSGDQAGPFEKLATATDTRLELRLDKQRYRFFRVRALTRSGLASPPSATAEDGFEAGYAFFQKHQFDQATDYFRSMLLRSPDDPAALEYLGRSLMAQKQNGTALVAFRQLQALPGQTAAALALQAEALYRGGRYRQADRVFQAISTRDRQTGGHLLVCARIKLKLGQAGQARSCLRQLLKTQPVDLQARLLELQSLDPVRDRKTIAAKTKWLQAHASRHKDASLLAAVGNYYLERGDSAEAGRWFGRSLQMTAGNSEARTGLVAADLDRKLFSQARSIALRMIADERQSAEGYFQLGNVAMRQGKPGEAVLAYRKSLSVVPGNIQVSLGLARAYQKLDNESQARDTLAAVLRADPRNSVALLELAQIELKAGSTRAAARLLRKELRFQPQNIVARSLLFDALGQLGDTHLATEQALILSESSQSEQHTRQLAEIYYRQGRLQPALVQYRKLLRKHRNSVDINMRIGAIYHQSGQDVLARKVLERVVRLNRKNEKAQSMLAQVYGRLGLYKSAIRAARSALAINASTDNRLLLESLKSDRDNSLRNKKHGPVIVIDKLELQPVLATGILPGKTVNIGYIHLSNHGRQNISNLTLKLYIGDFVDAGLVDTIPVIKAGAGIKLALPVNLSGRIDELIEDQSKSVDVELTFSDVRGAHTLQDSGLLSIYGRHAVNWQSPRSIDRFVTPGTGMMAWYKQAMAARAVTTDPAVLPAYLSPVVDVYCLLVAHDIHLDEPAPASERIYLQYPFETLAWHHGNTADTTILFASVLLAAKQRIAIAGTMARPLLLVDSGMPWPQRAQLGIGEQVLFQHHGTAWLPLDMGRWQRGLQSMWEEGSAYIGEHAQDIPLIDLQTTAATPGGQKVVAPDGADARWSGWHRESQANGLQHFLLEHSVPGDTSTSLLQQASWYRQNGYWRPALRKFQQALEANAYSYDAATGIGDSYLAAKQFPAALEYYSRASWLEPFDTASLESVAQVLLKLKRQQDYEQVRQRLQALAATTPKSR